MSTIGKSKFLVTGANGDIANAVGRVLQSSYPEAVIIGADLGERWPGRCTFSEMHTVPKASDKTYIDTLKKLAIANKVTCIIPCTEPELNILVTEWGRVRELPLLINDPDVVYTGLDKLKTNRWLASLGLDVPKTSLLEKAQANDLPLFIKPRTGSGSRNLEVVYSDISLAACREERSSSDFVAQELLQPHLGEFTCAIFKYKDHVRTLIMRRWLSGGLTTRMIVEEIPGINKTLNTIAEALPDTANINVQLRLTPEGPRVFEINPRLSSTIMMRHKIGFTDLKWWIDAASGKSPPPFVSPNGYRVYRTYNEVVVSPGDVEN